jgi:hypothetical protein
MRSLDGHLICERLPIDSHQFVLLVFCPGRLVFPLLWVQPARRDDGIGAPPVMTDELRKLALDGSAIFQVTSQCKPRTADA